MESLRLFVCFILVVMEVLSKAKLWKLDKKYKIITWTKHNLKHQFALEAKKGRHT